MQYHLNGVDFSKPFYSLPITTRPTDGDPEQGQVGEEVYDVVIVGTGPTGLILSAQLSRFPQLRVKVLETKPAKLEIGQADGVQCRSLEIFEAFGFSQEVLREGYWVNEVCFWSPSEGDAKGAPAGISRVKRVRDTEEDLSRIHELFLDQMSKSEMGLRPDYSNSLESLTLPDAADPNALIQVRVSCVRRGGAEAEAKGNVFRARYVVGCDGAKSSVRKLLGYSLQGESANQGWGVMDVLVDTDFPDIRLKCAIHSKDQGSLLIIPREGGYLVRIYIELEKLTVGERVTSKDITIDKLISTAQRIFQPYRLEVKEVAWWSFYEIGQRLCDDFTYPKWETGMTPRVFIAGDACHTHSPKAGQGMNVSMNDGFNLGWKLASVLLGRSSESILRTYQQERRLVALELIDFDRDFAKMFSARPKISKDDPEGIDPSEFQNFFVKAGRFTAGTATVYQPSLITAPKEDCKQELAPGFPIGMRFHSAKVLRLSDAKPVHLGHTITADGRWRLFIFAGNPKDSGQWSKLVKLGQDLKESNQSPLVKYTPKDQDVDSVIDCRVVFSRCERQDIEIDRLPDLFWPRKGKYQLRDYEKVYTDSRSYNFGHGEIYRRRGIPESQGCLILVRPDQYVSAVYEFGDSILDKVSKFFDGFMKAPL
ncbi:tetracycline 6-hydroxylase protein [Violaceomyces palustris]|uniref:Tetracycline 6-hydroxylase protein n=1 Tax=Violaceomyces palustris TaxID=1673888 RepID=A0ACD0NW00_9BASI|nr:tetracycline 6-hydroxylase protein [Violaceomyces palustris]